MPSTERGQKTTASFKTRGKEKLQDEGSDKASKGRETKGVGTKDKLEQRTKERRTKAQNRKQRGGGGDKKKPLCRCAGGSGRWAVGGTSTAVLLLEPNRERRAPSPRLPLNHSRRVRPPAPRPGWQQGARGRGCATALPPALPARWVVQAPPPTPCSSAVRPAQHRPALPQPSFGLPGWLCAPHPTAFP